jgi:TonB family protein
MKVRSSNRVFVWALAISLTVHLVFAIVARTMPPAQAAPDAPTRVEIVHIAAPPPTPPPTPRPQPHRTLPTAARHPIAQHVRVSVPRPVAQRSGRSASGPPLVATAGPAAPGDVAASPVPSAPPRPACSQPFAAAHTIDAVVPVTPDDATGLSATAQVQVSLDDRGRVTDAHVYKSTGVMSLDRVAVDAARRSTYAPQIVDCQPAPGTYLFRVDFDS